MIHEFQAKTLAQKLSTHLSAEEDLCASILFKDKIVTGELRSLEAQRICGVTLFSSLFKSLENKNTLFAAKKLETQWSNKEDLILSFEGPFVDILKIKNLSLFFLSRMSAIFSLSLEFKKALRGSQTLLAEGRFFTPIHKLVEREALRLAGIHSHKRFFTKTVALKPEHLNLSSSLNSLLFELSEKLPPTTRIEVHPRNLEDVKEASDFGVDLIVLENFSFEQIKMAQRINQNKSFLEITGDLSLQEVTHLAKLDVNLISTNYLIKHSGLAPFSFNIKSL